MDIERLQEGSFAGVDTHQWASFRRVLNNIGYEKSWVVVDPFARDCPLADKWSNDINPSTSAKFNLDAQEFLESITSNLADLVVFDPPFSEPMAERKYGEGANLYAEPGRIPNMMLEICRILKPGGLLVKFGYNSTRHLPGFVLDQMYVVNFGGNRNDVIITVWLNTQTNLSDFEH